MKRETRGRVEASGKVKALVETLLLPTLNLLTGPWPASSSCSPIRLAGGLMQKLHQAQDLGAIAIEI